MYGGLVLLFDRMNRILDVDLDNMMVVVEPGVVTNEINERLRPHGLFSLLPRQKTTCPACSPNVRRWTAKLSPIAVLVRTVNYPLRAGKRSPSTCRRVFRPDRG